VKDSDASARSEVEMGGLVMVAFTRFWTAFCNCDGVSSDNNDSKVDESDINLLTQDQVSHSHRRA
jgi:hypothetical protein